MDDLIILVGETYTENEIGVQVATEVETPVWASLQSIGRQENYDAGNAGLNPEMMAVTNIANYHGEKIVQIGTGENSKRYGVYRTYIIPNSDSIELYLEGKVGVQNADSN